MNWYLVAMLVILFIVVCLAIYYLIKYKNRYTLIKFMCVFGLIIGTVSAQNITIPDDPYKPIVLPEIGKGIDIIVSSTDPALGIPEHGIRISRGGYAREATPDEDLGDLIYSVLSDYNFTDDPLDIDTAWPEFANVTNLTFTIA